MRAISAAVLALVCVGVFPSSGSGAPPKRVPLMVTVRGSGMVRFSPTQRVACLTTCHKTFRVLPGHHVTLNATATPGWKLTWRGACKGGDARCALHVTRSTRVVVRFVPPGVQANPLPLGTAAGIQDGGLWDLKVLSSQLQGQDLFVQIAATDTSGGYLDLLPLQLNIFIRGGLFEYTPASALTCTPPDPNFLTLPGVHLPGDPFGPSVPPGQTVTGYLCFPIQTNDAPFLLFTEPPVRDVANQTGQPPYPPDAEAVWFAIH